MPEALCILGIVYSGLTDCSHQFLRWASCISLLTATFPLLVSKKYYKFSTYTYMQISIPIDTFLTAFSQIDLFLKPALRALCLGVLHVTAVNLDQWDLGGSKLRDIGTASNLGLCF